MNAYRVKYTARISRSMYGLRIDGCCSQSAAGQIRSYGSGRLRLMINRVLRNQRIGWPVLVFFVHALAGLTCFFDLGTSFVLGCVDAFSLWQWFQIRGNAGGERCSFLFALGYFCLFIIFVPIARSPLLFGAFGLLYTASFRVPLLLGHLLILIVSVTLVTPYWIQTMLIGSILFSIVGPLFAQRAKRFHLFCFGFGFLMVGAILLPLLYLCFQVTPQTLITSVADKDFRAALGMSVFTASISTLVVLVFGVPLAYAVVRLDFPGKGLVESLIDLPIVIPQSVVGISILVLLGPKTPVGQFLHNRLGLEVAGNWFGIVLCQIFVSSPFLVRSAANAFRDMGAALENVSRTLGASPLSTFLRVSLPLASGGIFTGCILTWARAISEAGSLMILAYHPFTVSVYTYDVFIQYGLQESRPAAVLLVIVCLWGFLVLRWLKSMVLTPVTAGERRIGQ